MHLVVVVYYKDESECAQTDAHAQRPRHQDNIQAHHQTHRLRKRMGKESARGESRRDLSKVVVVYYKDESECNAQMDAHAQRPRHQDNIQAHHQTHRLRKSMGKESARGESRRDLSKAAAASKGAIG